MGRQMRNSPRQGALITDLVGLAMENNSLRNWPKDATAEFLDRSVEEELAANKTYREDIKKNTVLMDQWFVSAPEPEVISYLDRVKVFGEFDALKWLRERHPELVTP
jgi:hypothetical protein